MTVGQLITELQRFAPDRLVVVDVDLEHCKSDRNVLDTTDASDIHPETGLVFIGATSMSRATADFITANEAAHPFVRQPEK